MEFGININLGGNVNQAANQATGSLNRMSSAVEGLGAAADTSLGGLLALQSSIFVLVKAGTELQQFGFGVARGLTDAFVSGVKSSAQLEQSLSFLRIAAGKDFDKVQASVRKLAADTSLTFQDTVDVSRRLIGVGIATDKIFGKAAKTSTTGLEAVAAALANLSAVERTRAINSIGNVFQDINSASRLLNVTLSETEKIKFSGLTSEAKKADFILQLLDKRFKGTFGAQGLGGDLLFNAEKAMQNLTQLIQDAFEPVRTLLTPAFQKLNEQFENLARNQVFLRNLQAILLDFGKVALQVLEAVSGLIGFVARLIETRPGLVKWGLALVGIGSVIVGLIGTLIVVAGSIALFGLAISKILPFISGLNILLGIKKFLLFGVSLELATYTTWLRGVATSLVLFATNTWGAIVAINAKTAALFGLRAALVAVATAGGLVLSVFAALAVLPSWLKGFNSLLGATFQILKALFSIITGVLVGFFTLNPFLGVAAGAGTFAALEAVAPNPQTSGAPETVSSSAASAAAVNNAVRQESERPLEINNNIMLDGRVLANSVNRVNKTEVERLGFNTIERP